MPLVWNPDYAIGHDLIDAQHQELFQRFNALIAACKQQQGRQEIVHLFEFLNDYVEYHFKIEETLMETNHYSEGPMHRKQHREFVDRLRGWQRRYEQSGATFDLLVQTNEGLFLWLIQHIRGVDVELAKILRCNQP